MDFDELIQEAIDKSLQLLNGVYTQLSDAGTPINPGTIMDKFTADLNKAAMNITWGMPDLGMSEQEKDLREELGTEGTDVNEPVTKDAGMSEQEQELRNIFSALKDDPGDDRWEED